MLVRLKGIRVMGEERTIELVGYNLEEVLQLLENGDESTASRKLRNIIGCGVRDSYRVIEAIKTKGSIPDEVKYIYEETSAQQKLTQVQEKRASYVAEHNIMMTTGHHFEGYKIVTYFGVEGGHSALGTGFLSELSAQFNDLLGTRSGQYEYKLKNAEEIAKENLMYRAQKMGGNAVIGVTFSYTVFNRDIIGVVVNGTVVKIEKEISKSDGVEDS